MTTDREILPEHRNELKHPIKVWDSIYLVTKRVGDNGTDENR